MFSTIPGLDHISVSFYSLKKRKKEHLIISYTTTAHVTNKTKRVTMQNSAPFMFITKEPNWQAQTENTAPYSAIYRPDSPTLRTNFKSIKGPVALFGKLASSSRMLDVPTEWNSYGILRSYTLRFAVYLSLGNTITSLFWACFLFFFFYWVTCGPFR